MTVKELKNELKNIADDVKVTVFVKHLIHTSQPYMYNAVSAKYREVSPISNEEFEISIDEGFEY